VSAHNASAAGGQGVVPVADAIIAVLAALATLFANHSSTTGLERRSLAAITQTRASDRYNLYESSRIKVEVNEALLESGLVTSQTARRSMVARIAGEQRTTAAAFQAAQAEESAAKSELADAEHTLRSYERYEVAAALLDIAIVIVSAAALLRKTTLPLAAGFAVAVAGLAAFAAGAFGV
jgi:Domain of unknown function (DUF4337)